MKTKFLLAAAGLAIGVSGCMSMSGQSTLEAVQEAITGKTEGQVYTEAYIEFAGPASRWAGPATLLMHVSARDAGQPALVVPEKDSRSRRRILVAEGSQANVRSPGVGGRPRDRHDRAPGTWFVT